MGCERRQIARRRTEEEQRRSSSASDDDGGGFHARMREQPALEKIAWAPPSMSCRGPLVAGVEATSPADRGIRWIPATRHRRLR
jgi:hypothetical protein